MANKNKVIRKTIECIEYLSVEAPLRKVDYLEDKQSKYIHEYVKNKEYCIVGTMRRHGFDGVVIANMAAVSVNLLDAYVKVCEVVEAGGISVTVDEGRLGLNIKEAF